MTDYLTEAFIRGFRAEQRKLEREARKHSRLQQELKPKARERKSRELRPGTEAARRATHGVG